MNTKHIVSSTITGLTFSIDNIDYTNTTGIFTPVLEGTYKVTAKNANGCISTETIVTLTGCFSSIGSIDAGNDRTVLVYPNPFINSLTITIKDASQINNCIMKIYNTLGIEVLSKNITNQSTTLETSHLHSGVYFYRVINDSQFMQSGKLISK